MFLLYRHITFATSYLSMQQRFSISLVQGQLSAGVARPLDQPAH